MTTLPPLFLSHGSPMLALDAGDAGRFWQRLAETTPRPETIYDFYGFPAPLYQQVYPTPGAPALALRAAALLKDAGIACEIDPERGLDHGAWVPLRAMYSAGIPVASFAVQPMRDAAWHVRLGRALAPLTRENVLLLATGGAVHNLREMWREGHATPPWARDFDEWLAETLAAGDEAALCDWLSRAPQPRRAHPSPEHLMPIFVAYGAAGPGARGERIYADFTLGSMSMAAYRFR